MYLSHRRLVAQVDAVELGVTDIINGNLDRTFRPVGDELDGLANGLNVMLARLLGRPEPGDEEFDDDGNPIVPGPRRLRGGRRGSAKPRAPTPSSRRSRRSPSPTTTSASSPSTTPRARRPATPTTVSFENFIAKLKVNEGKLKAQYQCRAVRFRVVTKDGKVTLKPVPIFA